MANVRVNLSKIKYNAKVLQSLLERRHIHFTPVIKCVAGINVLYQVLSL